MQQGNVRMGNHDAPHLLSFQNQPADFPPVPRDVPVAQRGGDAADDGLERAGRDGLQPQTLGHSADEGFFFRPAFRRRRAGFGAARPPADAADALADPHDVPVAQERRDHQKIFLLRVLPPDLHRRKNQVVTGAFFGQVPQRADLDGPHVLKDAADFPEQNPRGEHAVRAQNQDGDPAAAPRRLLQPRADIQDQKADLVLREQHVVFGKNQPARFFDDAEQLAVAVAHRAEHGVLNLDAQLGPVENQLQIAGKRRDEAGIRLQVRAEPLFDLVQHLFGQPVERDARLPGLPVPAAPVPARQVDAQIRELAVRYCQTEGGKICAQLFAESCAVRRNHFPDELVREGDRAPLRRLLQRDHDVQQRREVARIVFGAVVREKLQNSLRHPENAVPEQEAEKKRSTGSCFDP